MSCEIFAKVRKDNSILTGIFSLLTKEAVDVLDVSAKPSLDNAHYLLHLRIGSDMSTAKKLFGKNELLNGFQIL